MNPRQLAIAHCVAVVSAFMTDNIMRHFHTHNSNQLLDAAPLVVQAVRSACVAIRLPSIIFHFVHLFIICIGLGFTKFFCNLMQEAKVKL